MENYTNTENQNQEIKKLSLDQLKQFMSKLSGVDADGKSKTAISYVTYAMEDDSPEKDRIFNLTKACMEISYDQLNKDVFTVDIIFRSPDEPELKMLWAKLQRFKRNMINNPEKTHIFYFNVLENASVDVNSTTSDRLFLAHIFNPIAFFITREVPDLLAPDVISDDVIYGGNIVRMLVQKELVQFEISDDYDISQAKMDALQELETTRYINNRTEDAWDN